MIHSKDIYISNKNKSGMGVKSGYILKAENNTVSSETAIELYVL